MHPTENTTGLQEMSDAWDEFIRSVRRARARSAARADSGELSLSQYLLVVSLLDDEALPTGELAARAAVSAPSATRMIDGLERDGVVRRAPSPEDRRVVLVSLTAEGRRRVEAKREVVTSARRSVAQAMSPTERVEAARILRRMADLVDDL